ncbi:MAG: gamma-butyrobetaine hydroxylase-like domain-containing protein, partial [Shewanella sp.]
DLATHQVELWENYLARLRAEKASREPLIAMNIKYN